MPPRAYARGYVSSWRETGLKRGRGAGIVSGLMKRRLFLGISLVVSALAGRGEEGYWLFTDPPTEAVAQKYHFQLQPEWLDHLRGAVVHIGGGTGSFVSADGLVITNHHIGEGPLHTLSTARHNYERDGFYAPARRDELPCQGIELSVLRSTENVTDRVLAAAKPGASPEEAEKAHRAVEAAIEKESFDRTGLESQVVTLFGGARYDLYRYQKYPDVRLVFAPDRQMGFFGGDPDNFEFPRYDLDICLLRVYDHGKPLATPDYLRWNPAGPAKDELIFVAGHPGFSQRLVTMDELDYQRDFRLPALLDDLHRLEHKLTDYSATSPEHARQALSALSGVANARKATLGFSAGLHDEALFNAKVEDEKAFRASLAQHPEEHDAEDAFAAVKQAVAADRANYRDYEGFERFASRSDLVNLARTLVRAAAERTKPNGERLPAYRDSALPALEFRLFSGRPFYPELEALFIADALERLLRDFGSADPRVQDLLHGESPAQVAGEWVRATKLEDTAYRRKLYAGGEKAIAESGDPLLHLAALLDPAARAARKIDDEDDEAKHRAYAAIYRARVALGRAPAYPDATGTLRLSYGTVAGYSDGHGTYPALTDFAGLFERSANHGDQPPFDLPRSWVEAKPRLNLATPFNFAATADILGGNSGSPVVNTKGEFVGIIFDGNEPSLAGRYLYDPASNRSVSVDSAAIVEALRKVYHAGPLAAELESGHANPWPRR
jgi:hypothetical protein